MKDQVTLNQLTVWKHLIIAIFAVFMMSGCGGGSTGNPTQDAAIAKMEAYANSNGTSAVPTLQDYLDAGVGGVGEEDIAILNDVILGLTAQDVDTQEEIQTLADKYGVTIPIEVIPTTPTTPTPSNVTPVATAQSFTVDEDSVGNSVTLVGTDADGDTLSYVIVTPPSNGTLTGSGSTRLYAPSANYAGADSFSFKVNDGTTDSAPVTVSITVTNLAEPILTRRDTGLDGVCATYTDKSGEDLNFNGVLDDAEVTITNATVFTNGTPILLADLKTMIANDQDVTAVNTCQITDMRSIFLDNATFNQDISGWNTAAVTDMANMFKSASAFNQDISGWNTAAVTDMRYMFTSASAFNQDISGWNTAAVTDVQFMFNGASAFNQDIGMWDTSAVTTMFAMFYNAGSFNQNISGWNVDNVSNYGYFSVLSPLTAANTPPKFLLQ